MAKVEGSFTDFGLDPMATHAPRVVFHPSGPGVFGLNILATKPVVAVPASNGYFSANLTPTAGVAPESWYTIELQWSDLPSRERRREVLPWRLLVPVAGGIVGDLLRVPSNPALVWTGAEPPANPSPGSWWQTPTGDLSEWDGDGWNFKVNLRGPAGYNATGAAEDAAALAAFTTKAAGPNVFATALEAVMATAAGAALDTAAAARRIGGRFVVKGDSNSITNSTATQTGDNWGTHLAALSHGRLDLVNNGAVSGHTTADMLATFDATVIAHRPDTVGIMGGTNDATGALTLEQTAANITDMVRRVRDAGAAVFLCTIPPRNMAPLGTPAAPALNALTTGGTLAAGEYRYAVVAVSEAGKTLASAETAITTTGATSSVQVIAPAVPAAKSFEFYRDGKLIGTAGDRANVLVYTPDRSFIDTGAAGTTAPPTADTSATVYGQNVVDKTNAINAWLRTYTAAHKIPLVDFDPILKAADGRLNPGYGYGGAHVTPATQARMGRHAFDTLRDKITRTMPTAAAKIQGDPFSLYPNGLLMDGEGIYQGFPVGWSGPLSSNERTLAARRGFLGKVFSVGRAAITPTKTGTAIISLPAITTGFAPGDRIRVALVYEAAGFEAGGAYGYVQVAAGGTTKLVRYIGGADLPPSTLLGEFTVQAGAANITTVIGFGRGTGTLYAGQIAVYNLTTATQIA